MNNILPQLIFDTGSDPIKKAKRLKSKGVTPRSRRSGHSKDGRGSLLEVYQEVCFKNTLKK